MGKLGATEIIIILVIILLLFGGKKIPELMRGLGKGIREFKDASKGETPSDVDKAAENK
ncbi:MAG: twin-arginine translocase TatA/TatE family subunit [Flavobacteriales bacterium]